jgi:hypothetical protein
VSQQQLTPAQIQAQNTVFLQHLNSNPATDPNHITQAQYDTAMKVQTTNLEHYNATQTDYIVTKTETLTPLTSQQKQDRLLALSTVAALPSSNEEALAIGAKNYITPEARSQYLKDVNTAYPSKGLPTTTYSYTPKTAPPPQPSPNARPAPSTQQPSSPSPLQQGVLGHNPNIFGATSNPITKSSPLINTPEKASIALDVVSVVAAAPILGPVALVKAGTLGLVASQGVKTGFTVLEGGDVSKSGLSPKEMLDAVAGGVVFSGASEVAISGVAKVAPRLIGEAANPIVNTVSKAGVNAALGGGANAVLSGGDLKATGEGAAFGAGFSLLGDVAGVAGAKISNTKTGQPSHSRWKLHPTVEPLTAP